MLFGNVSVTINFDNASGENAIGHNPNWPYTLALKLVALDQEKQMHYLISHRLNIDKIYPYAKDPNEPKYKFLIEKYEM